METSEIANWFGILTGVAFSVTFIHKIWQWFQTKIKNTQEAAQFGETLVTELLNKATTPARRADIYVYIQFAYTEMEAEHTRNIIQSIAASFSVVFFGISLVVLNRLLYTDTVLWIWRLSIGAYVLLVISVAMAQFFSKQLRNLQISWHKRVGSILRERAFHHVKET